MAVYNGEEFLSKLAGRLGRERRKEVRAPVYSTSPQDRVFQGADQDDLIEKIEKQCQVIHTDFRRTTFDGLEATLLQILDQYEVSSIVSAGGKRLEEYKLDEMYERWSPGRFVHIWQGKKGKENIEVAERADTGIVFSDVTLAESGTVVLYNDHDNGRSISLLPKTFIALIPKSTLVPRMTQAARLIHEQEAEGNGVPSCVSFITGPSNSADIEMQLIVGVHGPVKASYIVIEDR